MSGNKNRKLLKENKKLAEKRCQRDFLYDLSVLLVSAFWIFFLLFILFSKSLITSSPKFSIMLALLSFSVTLSFEIKEWCDYFQNYKNKTIKLFDWIPPLLFTNLLLIPLLLIYIFFIKFIGISKDFSAILPDIITFLSLLLYLFSYACRTIKIMLKKRNT